MTVNELFSVWLHRDNPNAVVKVWDRSTGNYIYDSAFFSSCKNVNKIAVMEVKCFFTSETKNEEPVLIINVGEYSECGEMLRG